MFEPLPWHISAASDVFVLFENILRGWLIWKAWRALRDACLPHRSVLMFIMFAYLIMETIWSIGTINWGTAARHHLTAIGLLLLAAFSASDVKRHV